MYMFVSLLRVKNYGKDTQFEMRKTAKFVWYNLLVFGQISCFFTRDLLVFQILEWHVWLSYFSSSVCAGRSTARGACPRGMLRGSVCPSRAAYLEPIPSLAQRGTVLGAAARQHAGTGHTTHAVIYYERKSGRWAKYNGKYWGRACWGLNSLAPKNFFFFFKLILIIDSWGISYEIVTEGTWSQVFTDSK